MLRNTYADGVLVESLDDNGDGTGTLTDYTTEPPTVTEVTGLPILPPEPPSIEEVFASLPVQTLEEANETLLALPGRSDGPRGDLMDGVKRSRLNSLTSRLWANVDEAPAQIESLTEAIAAAQADIDALVAQGTRTAAQNVELRCLRREIELMRVCRRLLRDGVATSRFSLFVAGRARPADVSGEES